MSTRDGGAAFPFNPHNPDDPWNFNDGMTLRDYFAGQFLTTVKIIGAVDADEVARNCYAFADAMLRERAKP